MDFFFNMAYRHSGIIFRDIMDTTVASIRLAHLTFALSRGQGKAIERHGVLLPLLPAHYTIKRVDWLLTLYFSLLQKRMEQLYKTSWGEYNTYLRSRLVYRRNWNAPGTRHWESNYRIGWHYLLEHIHDVERG